LNAGRRIAVPDDLFGTETMTGRGRMWHEVLSRLATRFDLLRAPGRSVRRAEAWLFDGHTGPQPVKVPQIIHLHEAPWREPETLATLQPEFLELVVEPSRRAAAAAAAVICPSESSKRQIVEDAQIAAERVFVAYHGVDHRVFRSGLSGGAALAAAYGADPDRPYVLSVATLHPRKNLPALRQAMAVLASEGLPHQLVLVGGPAHGRNDDDALRDALQASRTLAAAPVVMVPHGLPDTELAALMAGAAVFCLPSLSEGFGLPAAEAMACGTAAVLSRRGALPEVGGDAAVLVEPDTVSLTEGLRPLLRDPDTAAGVGAACAEQAARFTWDRAAQGWETALVAGLRAGPP
jgi:glycosyltransferase involved in cell wall biosynthesis